MRFAVNMNIVPVLLIVFVFSSVMLNCVQANQPDNLHVNLPANKLLTLSQHPQWLALLHYEKQGAFQRVYSEVDDTKFFYAEHGNKDPYAELMANITEFKKNQIGDSAIACRFPARLDFLQHFAPELQLTKPTCPAYDAWYQNVKGDALYLIFPASYMNSPSSMFGHTLLRLDGRQGHTLLSSAINFAAFTDPTDDEITFTVKGLTGGYPGYVSLVPYYEKVNEYNHIESRDIWEYQLKLDAQQIDLFTRHVWELNEIRFDYYFIDENCSYRLLTLLKVVNPNWQLTKDFNYRTVPTDTIRALQQYDLIGEVNYRPSQSTQLYQRSLQLSLNLQKTAQQLAHDPSMVVLTSEYQALSGHEKAQVLELAYDYSRYLNIKEKNNDPDLQKRSLKLLSLRSKLSIEGSAFIPTPVPEVRDEEGHKTYRTTFSAGQVNDQLYGELGMRINYHDWLDGLNGYREGAQIEMGHVRVRANDEKIQLQQLDVISIRSLGPRDVFRSPISWQVSGGYERWASDNLGHAHLRLAAGLAYEVSGGLVYGMGVTQLANGKRYEGDLHLAIGGEVGYLLQHANYNVWASYEQLTSVNDSNDSERAQFAVAWNITQDQQLRVQIEKQTWDGRSTDDLRLTYAIYH